MTEPVAEGISGFLAPRSSTDKLLPRRRRLTGFLLAGLALLLAGAAVWQFYWPTTGKEQASLSGRANGALIAVAAVKIEKGDIPIVLNGLGTVLPLVSTTVRTQISGRLTEIAFKEGDLVQAGDFLAEVDPRPFQIALAQYEGQLRRDQALLRGAEKDLARYTTLVAQDSASKQQLDSAETLVGQYRGAVMIDQALVDNAKLNLTYCRIVAPVSGRLGLRQVDLGNYVQATDSSGIVVITQLQPITVVFTVPQDNLPAVLQRVRAGANLKVTALDRPGVKDLASGELIAIDNQIDPSTGTVKLRAQFANENEALFPNQFVNAQLLVDVLKDAVIVPRAAIQHGAPGTFVYLVTANSTVSIRPVQLGPVSGDRVAVAAGLAAGDTVVIDGADRLREGARIAQPSGTAEPKGASNHPRKEKDV